MVFALAIGFVVFPAYGPLLLQLQFGTNPLIAGYIVASLSVAWTLGTLATAGASPNAETRLIRSGTVLITLGGIGLAVFIGSGLRTSSAENARGRTLILHGEKQKTESAANERE